MGRELGRWVLGGIVGMAFACSSPSEGGSAGPAAEGPASAAAPAPIEGCGGELRLLPGDQVQVGGRTVACGQLDQLLTEGVIDHVCLGALSKQGGRACIEQFVAESRTRTPRRPAPSPEEPATEP